MITKTTIVKNKTYQRILKLREECSVLNIIADKTFKKEFRFLHPKNEGVLYRDIVENQNILVNSPDGDTLIIELEDGSKQYKIAKDGLNSFYAGSLNTIITKLLGFPNL